MALPTRQTRPAPAPGGETATTSGSWLMLAVLLLGQFMCIIDVLVVNVAMPSIAASLHASSASLQLVVGGYTIAYAMLLNLAVLRAPALPSGLVTLAATQIAYGGLLFAFTLHLQAGLGESALRAGLSYLPMAAVFGLAGYNWRRLPAAARRVLVPAGLAVSTLAYLSLAAGLHTGTGELTWTGLAVAGLGLGLSVSPLLTQSLTHVPPARAADASGLLTTTVQLGQLLGVAAIGSVYLSRAAGSRLSTTGRAAASAAAMSGTACWLAALSVAGLLAAAVMVRAARGRRPAAAP